MFSKGDRIQLVAMPEDPDPVPVGTLGTVNSARVIEGLTPRPYIQLGVAWDNGRTLGLVIPPDSVTLVASEIKCDFCSSLEVKWSYPAKTFDLLPEFGWGSLGDWAACDTCAAFIDDDWYAELTDRAVSKMGEPIPGFRENLARLHLQFREARTGPKTPFPEAGQ